ncbi:MAG: ice-binding family protein [bacterium]|nr:ice-binding family protein [bacterium]
MNTMTQHNNRTKQILMGLALATAAMALHGTLSAAGPAPVNLRATAHFTILAGAAITSTGGGTINGDVGASPIAGSAIGLNTAQVNGIIYAVDASGPAGSVIDPVLLTAAKSDLTTAYNDAAGRTPIPTGPFLNPGAGNIGGLNLVPGLYKFTSTALITGSDVTLTGGPHDVWIFQIVADLQVGSGIHVILAGGAQARNIFWQVGSSAVLDTSSVFKGTILADQAITMKTSSRMEGRALAFEAGVTFNGDGSSLPVTDAPFVLITNTPPRVVFNAETTVYLAGTNNENVAGAMYWSNLTTGASNAVDRAPSSNEWSATVTGLGLGANHIHVCGTNVHGQVAFDYVTVVRLDAGPNPPYIDITSGPHLFITYDFTSATFGGTNCNVVGGMWWSNITTRAGGAMAATDAWSLTVGGLAVGVNELYVYGTNTYGAFASAFIDIERGAAGTGANDVDMFLAKMQCRIKWTGTAANRLTISGKINPRGANRNPSGATVGLSANGAQLLPPAALDSHGIAAGVSSGVTYRFRFDWRRGSYFLTMKGLDLRASMGMSNETAMLLHELPMRLTIAGANLEIPLVIGTFECPCATTAGQGSKLTFRSTANRTLTGVYQCNKTVASQKDTGHNLKVNGVIEAEGGGPVVPTGDITVTIGDATLVMPFAHLVGRGTTWSYKNRTAQGITGFSLDNRKHTFVLSACKVAGTGIPLSGPAAPAAHRLQIQLQVPTADGVLVFDSIVEILRRSGATRAWKR